MRILVLWMLCSLALAQGLPDLVLEASLPGLAVLQIDGERITLREGQSHGPVRLLDADASGAVLDIDGTQQRLEVSQRISASFSAPARRSVTLRRDSQLQYRAAAQINGTRLAVILDTGANVVAMNANDARRAGIAADEGEPIQVQTAGAVVQARRVMLDFVDLAGIRVNRVEAAILPGDYPTSVLLGMSFLRHVELDESDGVLTLESLR